MRSLCRQVNDGLVVQPQPAIGDRVADLLLHLQAFGRSRGQSVAEEFVTPPAAALGFEHGPIGLQEQLLGLGLR
jgi:hypothetical protein